MFAKVGVGRPGLAGSAGDCPRRGDATRANARDTQIFMRGGITSEWRFLKEPAP
jgi:hypothetical protein